MHELTASEIKVLDYAARGHTAARTASALRRSVETVKHHRRRAMAKLGAENIAHAVAIAMRREVIT